MAHPHGAGWDGQPVHDVDGNAYNPRFPKKTL